MKATWLVAALMALAPRCTDAQHFPGTYAIVGYAEPGTHQAGHVPHEMQQMVLTLRADGSVTMHKPGEENEDYEYTVNAADSSAVIVTGGSFVLRARFSHDTLVTRVPGGGPAFYWRRSK